MGGYSAQYDRDLTQQAIIQILPVCGLPEVEPGANLAQLLAVATAALRPFAPHDVLVVTQKIVSKAEGRYVELADIEPGAHALALAEITGKDPALVDVVLRESVAVVRAAPNVLITRHRTGHVMANAGIDRSNFGPGREGAVLLLPEDADASAHALRADAAWGDDPPPAVVISDSFGRPWRYGVVGVAIGADGLPSLVDRRGELDRAGRPLEVTEVALADILATAAGLTMGEGAEGVPAALVRGIDWHGPSRPAAALVRSPEQDLFR